MNYNKVTLLGRVTRDVELKYMSTGTAVVDFSLAINHVFKKQSGEKVEEVSFIDITAFGKQAETIEQYVGKGQALLIEGRLKQDRWETDGQKRSKIKVVLESFQFISSGKRGEDDTSEYDNGGINDEDMPF